MPLLAPLTTADIRFPTNITGDGTDAMNKECDYSAAYIIVHTDAGLEGRGMTFSELSKSLSQSSPAHTPAIGRGNEIVCFAINEIAKRIVGKDADEIFADMGAFWNFREWSE